VAAYLHDSSILLERTVEGVTILTLARGLKGKGENHLKERLDHLVRSGNLQILIDLKNLPQIDSTELGRLIRCHLSVRQAGGRVRICNVSEKVRTVMKLTHLDTILELYGTESEALAEIKAG